MSELSAVTVDDTMSESQFTSASDDLECLIKGRRDAHWHDHYKFIRIGWWWNLIDVAFPVIGLLFKLVYFAFRQHMTVDVPWGDVTLTLTALEETISIGMKTWRMQYDYGKVAESHKTSAQNFFDLYRDLKNGADEDVICQLYDSYVDASENLSKRARECGKLKIY